MNNQKYSVAALFLGLPLCAVALDLRDQPVHSLVVVPMPAATAEAPEGRQASPRLRETLRQSLTDGDGLDKPFRLSPEERQRMREQLRGQPEQAARTQ